MAVSVTMPRLGESVSEGTVTRWLKKEGERVEADEPLLEVSTDKVDTEIPSPAGGVLKSIKAGEDETVEVGSELAVIEDGAGGGGGSRKQDVRDAANKSGDGKKQDSGQKDNAPSKPQESTEAPAARQTSAPAKATADQATRASIDTSVRGRTEKLSRLRTVIAQRMVESLQISAQLTTVVEVDLTRIARLREQAKAEFEGREGVKRSYLPFFALAPCEALREHPAVNASMDVEAGTATYHDSVHLGVAVDTPRGVLVPVIKDASDLNLPRLARKIAD